MDQDGVPSGVYWAPSQNSWVVKTKTSVGKWAAAQHFRLKARKVKDLQSTTQTHHNASPLRPPLSPPLAYSELARMTPMPTPPLVMSLAPNHGDACFIATRCPNPSHMIRKHTTTMMLQNP